MCEMADLGGFGLTTHPSFLQELRTDLWWSATMMPLAHRSL
jgi:hypothetical protein